MFAVTKSKTKVSNNYKVISITISNYSKFFLLMVNYKSIASKRTHLKENPIFVNLPRKRLSVRIVGLFRPE